MRFLFLLVFLIPLSLSAQINQNSSKGYRYFQIGNFDAAIEWLQKAVYAGDHSPLTYYRLGVSYVNQPDVNDQLKAIEYLEKARDVQAMEVPNDVFFYLGKVYHLNTDIKQAIESYKKFRELAGDDDQELFSKSERELEICKNALTQISMGRVMNIERIGPPISTEWTEYNPVVSTDESVMAFTALRPNEDKSGPDFVEDIYITYRQKNAWSATQKIEINTEFNVGTAGISPDGENMIIFIGAENGGGNLYTMDHDGTEWEQPVTMGPQINSRFLESTGSITPDGKRFYFASNRPDGSGGMDIYMVEKNSSGEWGEAKNLGPGVNSKYDDDAPFIHPDGKTLFFTSNGHGTIGGRDIFKTVFVDGAWSRPQNMGYPINTPANDNYFTLTADAKKGFFSSDRKGGLGGQDIYVIDLPDEELNIPLTMVKGKILAGENLQPVPTKILVVDKQSGEKIDYVYNPNSKTGNYLIIFPPGKNYDMIIESEGYMPYTININIPNQTYFYELFQQIHLKPIKQFDVVVGQEVSVKNAFYDTKSGNASPTVRQINEAMLIQNDSIDIYDLMSDIIAAEDTTAYEYLLDLMFTVNPVENVDFENNEQAIESAARSCYYDESTEDKLEKRVIEGRTIFSLPTLSVTEEHSKKQEKKTKSQPAYDPEILNEIFKVYFDAGQSELNEQYLQGLTDIYNSLEKYPDLSVEISGYASKEGDAEFNRKLSNKRAIEVLNFFNYKGIVRRRIVAKGYGSTGAKTGNKEESRRVEVRLIDQNKTY
jgi:outer membrane protein OmpA-like peptidoglycan-associated protein